MPTRNPDYPQVAVIAPTFAEAWEEARTMEEDHPGYEFVAVSPDTVTRGYRFAYVHPIGHPMSQFHPRKLDMLYQAMVPGCLYWEDREREREDQR